MIDQYIRQYGRQLDGLCRTLCPNPFDADDLYQETWLRVVKHIGRYDPGREFGPWLTKICVNTYRSTLRRLDRGCVCFAVISTAGSGAIAIVYVQKGGADQNGCVG